MQFKDPIAVFSSDKQCLVSFQTNLMDKRPSDKRVPENRMSDTKPETKLEPQKPVKQQGRSTCINFIRPIESILW